MARKRQDRTRWPAPRSPPSGTRPTSRCSTASPTTLGLGDPDAAKLLAEARDPAAPAPKEVPAVLRDAKLPAFFRANLALAYAKALTGKRVYEEALEALKTPCRSRSWTRPPTTSTRPWPSTP